MKTIGDALREYADEREHEDYFYRARVAVAAYSDQPATERNISLMQQRLDHLHRHCSSVAGRRLRRITVEFDAYAGATRLIVEPYDPMQTRQPWPPQETNHERSEN